MVLVGTELISFIEAHTLLCFGFLMKTGEPVPARSGQSSTASAGRAAWVSAARPAASGSPGAGGLLRPALALRGLGLLLQALVGRSCESAPKRGCWGKAAAPASDVAQGLETRCFCYIQRDPMPTISWKKRAWLVARKRSRPGIKA